MNSSFFQSNTCSRSMLAKTWRLCRQLAAITCDICYVIHNTSAFSKPNIQGTWAEKSEVEDVDLPMLKKYNFDVKTAFTHLLSACLLSCNLVAASRVQIVPEWPPVACKVNFIHVACDWRPHGYNLHATGGHGGTNCMRLAASRMQILHALPASCVQSRQF